MMQLQRKPTPTVTALTKPVIGRTLGLHVKGIEENSRSKREGIFQEDECIVQINDTELIDKSFAHWTAWDVLNTLSPVGGLSLLRLLILTTAERSIPPGMLFQGCSDPVVCISDLGMKQVASEVQGRSQEVFRQAMSSPVVRLEVLPVANKLHYEKSLIGQLFTGPEVVHPAVAKVKSPFLLRKASEGKLIDQLARPRAETPPPEETPPPVRHAPTEAERRQETPPPPVSASPTPKVRSESPTSRRSPALTTLLNTANKKGVKKTKINLTKGGRVSSSPLFSSPPLLSSTSFFIFSLLFSPLLYSTLPSSPLLSSPLLSSPHHTSPLLSS
ncbi:hypothetical protein NFI96_005625 [Prochilodus magdalenae]|nr:hypothetical protein NFI96_005625 [Prochilodus magdalenae]